MYLLPGLSVEYQLGVVLPDGFAPNLVLVGQDHLLNGGTQLLAVHHPEPVFPAQADGTELWGGFQ